jgi:hypothetical protein
MTRPSFWPSLIAFIRSWTRGARRDDPIMEPYLREVRIAQDIGDTRRVHSAIQQATRARTRALARELGRQVFEQ